MAPTIQEDAQPKRLLRGKKEYAAREHRRQMRIAIVARA